MDYNLEVQPNEAKQSVRKRFQLLLHFLQGKWLQIILSFTYLLINSATVIAAPFMIGDITNEYLPTGNKDGLLWALLTLAGVYLVGAVFSYLQIRTMGRVGQRVVYGLRAAIFDQLQTLPLSFFNQNKSGDLISRINNDTEKMSQAFSETLLRFTGDIVVIIGIAVAMLYLNQELGMIAIVTLLIMIAITWLLGGWIKYNNDRSLQSLGNLSGQVQESLANFKVTVAFNRRDYFRKSFATFNQSNRKAATWAGVANSLLAPIYNYAGTVASAIILVTGIQILIIDKVMAGQTPEFGSLLTFILYSSSFFNPLKEMGELFSLIQVALASWSRIYKLLSLKSNLQRLDKQPVAIDSTELVKFDGVSFGYSPEVQVLKNIDIELLPGKTYALVGPTGGGKSTTASLMTRLYDASEGKIIFRGQDIRTYLDSELAQDIGFILQDPFLFAGTIAENIKYGNAKLDEFTNEQLADKLKTMGLEGILERFSDGLNTVINPGAENISLGQRQLISFVRALLREPQLLILDEATANIDTVTEQLLEEILNKLPATTTKVIIAHRLNTIERADQIFFISGGRVEKPMDFASALSLINVQKGVS